MHLFEVREYVSNDNQQIYIGTLNIDRHSCANTSANCRRIYRFRYTASPAPPGLQLITPVHHSICYPAIPYPLGSIHGNMLCCAVPVLDCTRCARGKTMFSAHRTNHWRCARATNSTIAILWDAQFLEVLMCNYLRVKCNKVVVHSSQIWDDTIRYIIGLVNFVWEN